MKRVLGTISLFFILVTALGQSNQAVPFTLNDRDRIIKTEEKVGSLHNEIKSLRNEMNTRFDANDRRFEGLQHQIDDVKWGLGIIISLMIFMMGYMIWDRRTAMLPIKEKVEQNDRLQEDMKKALIEYSKKDPKLANILRSFGIF